MLITMFTLQKYLSVLETMSLLSTSEWSNLLLSCMQTFCYLLLYCILAPLLFAVYLKCNLSLLACVEPVIVQPKDKNLTDLSFTLEWSPITTPLLQNYTLNYTSRSHLTPVKRQTDNQFISETIPAGLFSYTVGNMTPYSSYCFSLQASYVQEGIVFSQEQSGKICDINTPPIGEL